MDLITAPAHAVESIGRYGRELMPLAFLAAGRDAGRRGGLVVISGISGGTPKPLGTYMAVLADGAHAGNISGGCVEAAVAAEVRPLLAGGADHILRFGRGSCYIDIQFPCGGGVDLLVHAAPSHSLLAEALLRAERREPFAIVFDPRTSRSTLAGATQPTGWQGDVFVRRHLPRPRLLLVGRGPDLEVMARVAAAAEFDVSVASPDDEVLATVAGFGVPGEPLRSPRQTLRSVIDPWTAVVLLFHEHEWETRLLAEIAAGPAFYVGALGSQRTHDLRRRRLAAAGVDEDRIDRIRGPIGLVDRARDPATLALSVLAEVSAAWADIERR